MKEGGNISNWGWSRERKQLEMRVKEKGPAKDAYLSRLDEVRPGWV